MRNLLIEDKDDGEFSDMSPRDDTQTRILIQISGDIGEARAGINNLKDNLSNVTDDIKDMKDKLVETVNKEDCTMRHRIVADSITGLKKDIIAEFKRSPSKEYVQITNDMLRHNKQPTIEEIEEELQKKEEERAEKKRKQITFWLTSIVAAFTLITSFSIGLYRLFSYVSRLDANLTSTSSELRKEIQYNKQSKIVYIHTSKKDVGVTDISN
jgi:hypothetical protein